MCCGIQPGAAPTVWSVALATSSGHQPSLTQPFGICVQLRLEVLGAGMCASHSGQCMSVVVPVRVFWDPAWGWPTVWSVALATSSGHQPLASPALQHLCAVEVGGVGGWYVCQPFWPVRECCTTSACCGIQAGAGQRCGVWHLLRLRPPTLTSPALRHLCAVEVGGVGAGLSASHSGQCMSVVVPVHCCEIQPGAGQRCGVWHLLPAQATNPR
jgi:hypothetical protein